MKKLIVVPGMLVVIALGAYLGFAHAQQGAPVQGTKVAVVDVRAVLKQHPRAIALQAELEEEIKPHKAMAKKLTDELDALGKSFAKPNSPTWNAVYQKNKEWEAVNATILRIIEEKHKTRLPPIWAEVNQAIDAIAKKYGFQVVIGYGDPEVAEVSAFQTVRPNKMRTTDMGCTAVMSVHASVDLTPVVIAMMKQR